MQIEGGKAGGMLHVTFPCGPSVVIPGKLSARLTHDLKLNTGHLLLRFSILKGTPAAPQAFLAPCVQQPHLWAKKSGILWKRAGSEGMGIQ